MPQLQRRALPDRENDSRNYAPDHRNYTRFDAVLHLPVWYLVDEAPFAAHVRDIHVRYTEIPDTQKRKTRHASLRLR